MAISQNRCTPELNELIELLENATPGSIKKATKYAVADPDLELRGGGGGGGFFFLRC